MGKNYNEQEVVSRNQTHEYRAEYDAQSYVIYEGWAAPGTMDTQAKWNIAKHTYDSSGNLTQTTWSSVKADFTDVWDNRSSYF